MVFEDLKTKLGQKKLTALQEIMQGGKTMGVNPELAIRAGKERICRSFVKNRR